MNKDNESPKFEAARRAVSITDKPSRFTSAASVSPCVAQC